mgnify:CR=1 FL=1
MLLMIAESRHWQRFIKYFHVTAVVYTYIITQDTIKHMVKSFLQF